MIVCDENLAQYWLNLFRKKGFDILSIRDNFSGIPDEEVIQKVIELKAILVTEDKDFGEIVFSQGVSNASVVLLRYDQPDYESIETFLIDVLDQQFQEPEHYFYTITKNQVRRRRI
jgi:predicted nuclease of predicted toxin-antitoxin system